MPKERILEKENVNREHWWAGDIEDEGRTKTRMPMTNNNDDRAFWGIEG